MVHKESDMTWKLKQQTTTSSQAIRLRFRQWHTQHTHTHSYTFICIYITYTCTCIHCFGPYMPLEYMNSWVPELDLYNVAKSEFKSHWLINVHGNIREMFAKWRNLLIYFKHWALLLFWNLMVLNTRKSLLHERKIKNIKKIDVSLKINIRMT